MVNNEVINNISDLIDSLNKLHDLQITFEISSVYEDDAGVLGRYDHNENHITLYLDAINQGLTLAGFGTISPDEYEFSLLVYCHELGHFIDHQKGRIELEFTRNTEGMKVEQYLLVIYNHIIRSLGNEYYAWKEGIQFVPSNMKQKFHEYNYMNMEYRYNREMNRFIELCRKLPKSDTIEKLQVNIVKSHLECLSSLAEFIPIDRFQIINESLGIKNWEVIYNWEDYI